MIDIYFQALVCNNSAFLNDLAEYLADTEWSWIGARYFYPDININPYADAQLAGAIGVRVTKLAGLALLLRLDLNAVGMAAEQGRTFYTNPAWDDGWRSLVDDDNDYDNN